MSRSEHLLLPRQFYSAMIQQAQAELPNECCGLLAGAPAERFFYQFPHGKKAMVRSNVLRVLAWHPLVNEADSPTEYHAEESVFLATKAMRQAGHEIVAIYHSHPTSEPSPSEKDLAGNFSGDSVVHFIIGLAGPEPIVRGWWLTETTFETAAWQIVEA